VSENILVLGTLFAPCRQPSVTGYIFTFEFHGIFALFGAIIGRFQKSEFEMSSARVQVGIENLLRRRAAVVAGSRIGAVVHPASVLSDLRHTADALAGANWCKLVSLFGPQHGARGEKQDNMVESGFYRDPDTKLPVHSLYGATRWPTEEMLSDIDLLLFDLQDVGTRVYTFIYTMAYCMEACAQHRKRMVVLDRPNPISGARVEGNLLQMEYRSFVGRYPIPMRHGMTVGELALFFNAEFRMGCDLSIIPMEGWERTMWFDQTGLPWVPPSPNIPTLSSAVVYPGPVIIEGTNISEGRGTTRPFELIGAPYINARSYAEYLDSMSLPGVRFRPAYFEPGFQKWAGILCGGVQIHVTDRDAFEPYLTGICAIAAARALYADRFEWRNPPYEYEYDKMPIDLLCGGREIPKLIESGAGPEAIRRAWYEDVRLFLARRKEYLLYP
jgi:uncharacterized protein YbbC (DUF1343 family)